MNGEKNKNKNLVHKERAGDLFTTTARSTASWDIYYFFTFLIPCFFFFYSIEPESSDVPPLISATHILSGFDLGLIRALLLTNRKISVSAKVKENIKTTPTKPQNMNKRKKNTIVS